MTSMYVFKGIKPVSASSELIDIVLSKTQRKTPTEVHPKYQIARIRGFYMRKVKFAAETFTEKLGDTVSTFPKIDEIHPFFADLINILYDKDHYKIALSQVNVVKGIVENIAKDYVKLLKYGDSLYRCKTLKIAAFGRMCTAVKKIAPSLTYLEEVRRHLGRLPNVDAFSPTVLVFGFPNVGKSSFLNLVSNAKIEVSPMPFSTQNLFVGHCLHQNIKIQFIDSPGVLERAIEDRNTIEMQSLTALAHLKTAVLFIIDVSETSGYSVEQQIALFRSLKPLFTKKPLLVGLSKVDLLEGRLDQASDTDSEELIEKRQLLEKFKEEEDGLVQLMQFSNQDQSSVEKVKLDICDKLIKFRLSQKKTTDGRRLKSDEDYLMGVRVQKPTIMRKSIRVQANIPKSVIDMRKNQSVITEEMAGVNEWVKAKMVANKSGKFLNLPEKKRETLRDIADGQGGAGVFNFPLQEHFMLEKKEWNYDKVPEVWNGINIIDYVDPEIEQKLAQLEIEETERLRVLEASRDWTQELIDEQQWKEGQELLKKIGEQKVVVKMDHAIAAKKRKQNKNEMLDHLRDRIQKKSKKADEIMKKIKRTHKHRVNNRRVKQNAGDSSGNGLELEGHEGPVSRESKRTKSHHDRSVSTRGNYTHKGYKGETMKRRVQKKIFKAGLKGDGDRGTYTKKPKHLFSGKMSNGTSDRR